MPDLTSSRAPPVKVTYLDRTKRKRTTSEHADANSDTSSETRSQRQISPMKAISRHSSKKSPNGSSKAITGKPPVTKKIDLRDVPGPSPRRPRRDSDGSQKTASKNTTPISQTKKPTHVRSSSSISSLKQALRQSGAPAPSLKKPRSSFGGGESKPVSRALSVSQSVEDEEDGSVADSIPDSILSASGGRICRTVKDRQEYFKNQSDCGAFGPHRAFCTRCAQFVNLNRKQAYAVGPWERHRTKCDQELASNAALPPNAEELVNLPIEEIFADQRVRRNAPERRAYLCAETHILAVEEDRVHCAKCLKWIAGKKGLPYDLSKWKVHRAKCVEDSPSERILAAERKLSIVNDLQVKTFDATTIECSKCRVKVVGNSGKDYDLGAWEEHKAKCRLEPSSHGSGSTDPLQLPSESGGGSSSSVCTDATVVASDHTSKLNTQPIKRARDEPEGAEDERPNNRPRTEAYSPPAKEAPGPMGWFLLPFKSFVRGFRESLKQDS